MARYIEEGALVSKLDWDNDIKKWTLYDDDLEQLPTADVVEVKHGHWIKSGNEKKCSVCDFVYYSNKDEWNGCPNCLSRMDGKGTT